MRVCVCEVNSEDVVVQQNQRDQNNVVASLLKCFRKQARARTPYQGMRKVCVCVLCGCVLSSMLGGIACVRVSVRVKMCLVAMVDEAGLLNSNTS